MNDGSTEEVETDAPISIVPGMAVLGLFVTGFFGIWSGEGLGFLAAAVAFGVIFYVSFE